MVTRDEHDSKLRYLLNLVGHPYNYIKSTKDQEIYIFYMKITRLPRSRHVGIGVFKYMSIKLPILVLFVRGN